MKIQFFLIIMGLLLTPFSCKVDVKNTQKCGDGHINDDEQCDSDNLNTQTCLTLGYHGGELACSAACTLDISACLAMGRCGDGQLQSPMEQCDGEALGDQTCTGLGYHGGTLECLADCTFDTISCETQGRCGDGVIQAAAGETCDGDALDGHTCESLGYYGGELACGDDCTFDTINCEQAIFCGDGIIQAAWGETCDGANLDGEDCASLNYYGGALACGDDCAFDTTPCEAAGRCGDGAIQTSFGEDCDGAHLGGASCQTLGFATGELFCRADCTFDTGACFNWTSIAAGGQHTCAIGPDETMYCWGANDYGQLGDGTTTDSLSPVQVLGLTGVRQISAGTFHTCAVRTDDTVWCWGYNGDDQLGDLSNDNQAAPAQVFGPLLAGSVSAGLSHTCARLLDGSVRCWGDNYGGQLGDGTTTSRAMPTAVLQVAGAVDVSANDFSTCALLSDGSVRCWGINDYGQLGDGTSGNLSATPVIVDGLDDARTISVGRNHACAVRAGGDIACWGRNNAGQCGDGTTVSHATFVTVYNLTTAAAVSCGGTFTCARLTDGAARCWGGNEDGQLGDGTTSGRLFPVTVQGLSGVLAVSCGAGHTCAATDEATLYCWGLNIDGQLGDGTTTSSTIPIEVQ